ncbi:MAG TPA: DUF1775 domain-containing protein [Patescibacteria group bacterium]|nr:DUF1775 domain-containing protein [Patescibacteria group bacterium]
MRKTYIGVLIATGIMLTPAIASAHVVVSPSTITVGEEATFSMSVPNEREAPITQVKISIPNSVSEVTPTVHAGWTITTEKSGDTITSIIWSEGQIPAGQREDFTFSAAAPADAGALNWKAYETYSDGTLVSWNQVPNGTDKDNPALLNGPYSITKVQEDDSNASTSVRNDHSTLALLAAIAAIGLSAWTIVRARTRTK